jgi:hypothetical protein
VQVGAALGNIRQYLVLHMLSAAKEWYQDDVTIICLLAQHAIPPLSLGKAAEASVTQDAALFLRAVLVPSA